MPQSASLEASSAGPSRVTVQCTQAAKQEVTVSLSGDAGDELFGGYNRYLMAPALWKKISWMPFPARKFIGNSLHNIPTPLWDKIGDYYNLLRSESKGVARLGDKITKILTLARPHPRPRSRSVSHLDRARGRRPSVSLVPLPLPRVERRLLGLPLFKDLILHLTDRGEETFQAYKVGDLAKEE